MASALAQDFDVRRYAFDTRLQPLADFSELTFAGEGSALSTSLRSLTERFYGRPIGGVLLLTDGNGTDLPDEDWKSMPPVYPVVLGDAEELADISVSRVSVSQTNFEAAPVTLLAEISGRGLQDRTVIVRVLDEAGKEIERRAIERLTDDQPLAQSFQIRPEKPGLSFYTVQATLEGEEALLPPTSETPSGYEASGKNASADDSAAESSAAENNAIAESRAARRSAEATLANNRRLVVVDRGGGPYRVLYVSGRPNWEFKFLRRALTEDDEVELVGLVRIAKREPKFTFRNRAGERSNPIFRGFENKDEQTEQYDEPVLLRLGIEQREELRAGFPKSADELFAYHALVIDDLEAEFFRQDQLSLIQQFVSQRGGGLLMLGGRESFVKGEWARTPVGDLLPVYVDRGEPAPPETEYRLHLTREGWLQPWVRVRATEQEEAKRLAEMPGFRTVNFARAIKPGASVLASVESPDGRQQPALAVQSFGRGRAAALLIGDLWRWNMRRPEQTESDLEKSWRQTVRWLVADVPKRVEIETRQSETNGDLQRLTVRVRDERYEPLDNATVKIVVTTPDNRQIEIAAEPSDESAGEYVTTFASRVPGPYRATVTAVAADGSEVGSREAGWTYEPATDEFRTLAPNRPLLERIARETGGEVIPLNRLSAFVNDLPNRKIPVEEAWTYPLWHTWTLFAFAIGCLVGEWGLRRWKGLP
ncbi:MAG: glutamine amidotransferase [Pirellulaceae bacterium]